MNTDVNWLTKALALLVYVAAGMAVGVYSGVGVPWLSFRRDFMYDQNGLGFSFNESPILFADEPYDWLLFAPYNVS